MCGFTPQMWTILDYSKNLLIAAVRRPEINGAKIGKRR